MKAESAVNEQGAFLESLAAELTVAAYELALRYGVRDKWHDLQLDLWGAMTQALAKRCCLPSSESRQVEDRCLLQARF